jgi:hypothetical protein
VFPVLKQEHKRHNGPSPLAEERKQEREMEMVLYGWAVEGGDGGDT